MKHATYRYLPDSPDDGVQRGPTILFGGRQDHSRHVYVDLFANLMGATSAVPVNTRGTTGKYASEGWEQPARQDAQGACALLNAVNGTHGYSICPDYRGYDPAQPPVTYSQAQGADDGFDHWFEVYDLSRKYSR